MILHRPTPFARRQITDRTRLAIETAEPRDYRVHIGKGTQGWTCRILTDELRVVGETYGQPSIDAAFRWAVADMEARQVMTEAGVAVP